MIVPIGVVKRSFRPAFTRDVILIFGQLFFAIQPRPAFAWLDSFFQLPFSGFEHKQARSSLQPQGLCQADQTTMSYATHDAGGVNVCCSYPEFVAPFST